MLVKPLRIPESCFLRFFHANTYYKLTIFKKGIEKLLAPSLYWSNKFEEESPGSGFTTIPIRFLRRITQNRIGDFQTNMSWMT
jgi:hypothetical protein